jgi:hypothetical protein
VNEEVREKNNKYKKKLVYQCHQGNQGFQEPRLPKIIIKS